MRKEILYSVFVAIFLAITSCGSPDVAYVKSQQLVYNYKGMKEAQSRFETEKQLYKIQLDSLQIAYRALVGNYQLNAKKLTDAERKQREDVLMVQQSKIQQEQMQIQEKLKEREDKLTQGVLNQVNAFVEQYGKENGYDLIFGTTLSGNILYGDEAIDITEEITKAINENYKPELP